MQQSLKIFLTALGTVAFIGGWALLGSITGESTDSSKAADKPLEVQKPKHEVIFISDPLGAHVYVDGEAYSNQETPATIELGEGKHNYKVSFESYETESKLYKPYRGKLNVTKATALNVWLDRNTQAEIEANEARVAEREAAAEAARVAEAATNGEAVRYNGETIDSSLATVLCQSHIKDRLKAPSTAKFPGPFSGDYAQPSLSNNTWTYIVSVDAQNSFGAMIRSTFACVIDASADTITAEEF